MFSNPNQLKTYLKRSLRIAHSQNYRVLLVLSGEANEHLEVVCDVYKNQASVNANSAHQVGAVTRSTHPIMHTVTSRMKLVLC